MKLNRRKGTFKADWKPIEGYEGLYEVSNLGQVRAVDRRIKYKDGRVICYKGRICKLTKRKDGYYIVGLSNNGKEKTYLIHRLVAKAFIDNIDNKSYIDHINVDQSNNRVFNLRWVTPKENSNNPLTLKHISQVQKGKIVLEETRRKMSVKRKGRTLSEEHRRKIGESNRGREVTEETRSKISEKAKGHKVTEETKRKISKATSGDNNPRAKAVYCYEFDEIRLSATTWAEELGINGGSIRDNCRGRYKSAGGYHFRYATKEEIEEYKCKIISI